MRIFLIGFMGCGKSFVGKQLAAKLDMPYVDLDEMIEEEEKMTISEIFANHGEAYFRTLEKKYLYQLAAYKRLMVSCGGGTPCFNDNIEWINKHGLSIYLKTPADILVDRLKKRPESRPLITGKSRKSLTAYILIKLNERAAFYEKASVIYHQNEKDMSVAQDLADNLKQMIGH